MNRHLLDASRINGGDKRDETCQMESGTPNSGLMELLRLRAKEQPESRAFTFLGLDGEERASATYRGLDQDARRIARLLLTDGSPGQRALLLYAPGIEFISAFFGCIYAGIIAIPTQAPRINRSNERLQTIASDAEPSLVLTTSQILAKQERICASAPGLTDLKWLATDQLYTDIEPQRPDPLRERTAITSRRFLNSLNGNEEPAEPQNGNLVYLQYTSGSTAVPKGVMVSDANVLANCEELSAGWPTTAESVFVTWLPHFHDMGLVYGIIQPIYEGRPCYLMSSASFLQRPELWLGAISKYRATHSGGPNFAYDLCARRAASMDSTAFDLRSWSVAFSGAEPVRSETIDSFSRAFNHCGFRKEAFCPGYGLAEATLKVSSSRKDQSPSYVVVDRDFLERGRVLTPETSGAQSQTLVGCGLPMLDTKIAIVRA
ncbi:MAG: AMP-binding protein, partial [Blastocatellia bacterium]